MSLFSALEMTACRRGAHHPEGRPCDECRASIDPGPGDHRRTQGSKKTFEGQPWVAVPGCLSDSRTLPPGTVWSLVSQEGVFLCGVEGSGQ